MTKKKFLRGCAPWVLAAIAGAAEVRFGGAEDAPWMKDIAEAAQAPAIGRRIGFYLGDTGCLPSWALRAVAEAAGRRMVAHPADSVVRANIMTELQTRRQRRRAKEHGVTTGRV